VSAGAARGVARPGAAADAPRPYADGVELVLDLLAVLEPRLERMVEEAHGRLGAGEDPGLRGLVITDAEVARLLHPRPSHPPGAPARRAGGGPLWATVAERVEASRREGVMLPLEVARHRFALSDFETDCLVVCLAPEVDPRYERLFGYLNDDVTRRYPTVHLLLELLCPPGEAPIRRRRHLAPEAPLLRGRLLERVDDGRPAAGVSLPGRCLRVEEGVAAFLLHEGGLSGDVQALWNDPAWPPQAARLWDALPANAAVEAALDRFFGAGWTPGDRLVCTLAGRPGSGRAQAAEAACARRGLRLLPLDCRRLLRHEQPEVALAHAFRDSMLNAAPLLLAGADLLAADRERGPELRLALERLVAERGWLLFLSVDDAAAVRGWFAAHQRVEIELPLAAQEERARQWATLLTGEGVPAADAGRAAEALAARFRLTPGKAAEAVQHAAGARLREPGDADWWRTLHRSAARVSAPRLGELARKVEPLYRWGDIVLPEPRLDLLRDVLRHVSYRRRVMEEWRFTDTMSQGKGLNALFSGPPGTGKTMAAEIVAGELGLDLYRIDLATVVSKYIGETEKNLAAIFHEAQHSDCILFFDEADALFGKRSEVKDAHDRYANIEINYLLQQMEAYEGIAILATNLRQNLDEAFLRRIHVSVDFPLPGPDDRLRIWRAVLPPQAPRADDLDLPHLARAFDLTGGNIRNIALAAAYLAAEAGAPIGMAQLVRATHRELEKIGKRSVREQFGPYFHLLEPAPAPAAA